MFQVQTKYLKAASRFLGDIDHEPRLGICYVHVRPAATEGALVMASNGHFACIFYDRDAEVDRPRTIRLDFKSAGLKAKKRESTRYLSRSPDGVWSVAIQNLDGEIAVDHEVSVEEYEGEYPDITRLIRWRSLEKGHFEPGSVAFDLIYTARMSGALNDLGYGGQVQIYRDHQNDQMVIWPKGGGHGHAIDALFVLIPVRSVAGQDDRDLLRLRQFREAFGLDGANGGAE